jgi:hypothetical protein
MPTDIDEDKVDQAVLVQAVALVELQVSDEALARIATSPRLLTHRNHRPGNNLDHL